MTDYAKHIVSSWLRANETEVTPLLSKDTNVWATSHAYLVKECQPGPLILGTGDALHRKIYGHDLDVSKELIIVTCFWYPDSVSTTCIADYLRALSRSVRGDDRSTRVENGSNISEDLKVYICFSSLSPCQKLFHPQNTRGRSYGPRTWPRLGLPRQEEISSIKLHVKSIFIKPFSVWHPKFIIADRQKAFLPSCNVSWEQWLEGAVTLKGPIVALFVAFWESMWQGRALPSDQAEISRRDLSNKLSTGTSPEGQNTQAITTLFLPSSHHVDPRFRPFSGQKYPAPPQSPLNTFTLHILDASRRSIFMQTPNLTSLPIIDALLATLRRGVDVQLVTNAKLMRIEQIVTAGTTTSRCIEGVLLKRYREMLQEQDTHTEDPSTLESGRAAAASRFGALEVFYFEPKNRAVLTADAGGSEVDLASRTHLKCTIVDETITLLGSGNMDRASWYTSQELSIALLSESFAADTRQKIQHALQGKLRRVQ